MNLHILVYLIAAGTVGWGITEFMNDRPNLWINILLAIAGAFASTFLLGLIFEVGTMTSVVNVTTMLVALGGSIVLPGLANLVRRSMRQRRFRHSRAGAGNEVSVAAF
jgi:uncharacterized membrane protein YeaQ/YmgE (transglycosylase-associated protein family)